MNQLRRIRPRAGRRVRNFHPAPMAPLTRQSGVRRSVNIREIFEIGATAAPYISVVAFVCSILFNQAIFRSWSISFLSVASPADVMMTGLLGLSTAALFAVIAFGALLFTYSIQLATEFGYWFGLKFSGSTKIAILASWVSIPGVLFPASFVAEAILNRTGLFLGAHNYINGGLALSVLFLYAPREGNAWRKFFSLSWENLFTRVLTVVAFAIFAANLTLIIIHEIENKAVNGFVRGHVSVAPPPNNCDLPQLMWMGERAIVFMCVDGKFTLSFNAENMSISPVDDETWFAQFSKTISVEPAVEDGSVSSSAP